MWDQQRQQEGGADIDCERQCIIREIPSSESSASVVSPEHCSTTSTTWSVTIVAAAHRQRI